MKKKSTFKIDLNKLNKQAEEKKDRILNLRLDPELYEEFKDACDGQPMSKVLREVIIQIVEQKNGKKR